MAGKKENIKALFSNTRSRIIILFTAVLLAIAVVVGIIKFSSSLNGGVANADISEAPSGIQSVPGAINPTAQYAALQEKQNIDQAKQAAKKGGSAIPTIIRTQNFGEGVEAVGPQHGEGGLGFQTLAMEDTGGPQQSLWLQSLKDANCSKASVNKVVSEGAALSDLKSACSCVQLKSDGYQFSDLNNICSCKELKAAGFNARQMKDAGFTAGRLRACGFDACELRAAGFTAQQMKDGGYSDGELKGAGFTADEIGRAGGLPNGITANDVRKAGCQVDALRHLREEGVTAAAISRISGCSATQLKAAGFSAQDLKNAGFSAAQLLKAGFSPAELRAAGYTARELLNAGLTPNELAQAGFTAADIKSAEEELPPGVTPNDVKEAGCSVDALKRERLAGVSATLIHQYAGCSAKMLKEAGFTDDDLANAGFSKAQIAAAQLVPDDAIRAAGCDVEKLKTLFKEGVSAKRIHALNGCSAAALKEAGFGIKALTEAGFSPAQLLAAGFTPEELSHAGVTDDAIRAAGCDVEKLKKLFQDGVSAKRIHAMNGCSAAALKEAGFGVRALADAGFSPAQLLAAGFSPEQLSQAGLTPVGVFASGRTANCSVASLKAARALGVSASAIRETLGCSAKEMKDAGYTAAELKDAGFTAAQLKNAGFSAQELKNAGFSAKALRAAGFSAADLKNAGFTAAELKEAGFSAADLKAAGFSAADLKKAGFSAADLKAAGFSAAELKNAGFSAADLKAAGFSAAELKNAGFSVSDLKAAGFDAAELSQAGFSAAQLQAAGFLTPDSSLTGLQVPSSTVLPSLGANSSAAVESAETANAKQLKELMKRQQAQMAEQRYQQKIQQRTAAMLGAATQLVQQWKTVAQQAYMAGAGDKGAGNKKGRMSGEGSFADGLSATSGGNAGSQAQPLIRAGDVLFAVLDTSVNSDEPGPILATIVSGKFKDAKLIGSFNLPSNADRMIITFNTLSVPGAPKTTSINAYAIDPNTARTALASRANHHYLVRYGSLFASTFLEGFGNAFQSANTTVTVGGVGGTQSTTISNGIGRSIMENAVIGLATLGKTWGQIAQQQFNTPTTVELYSGVGFGVLFTQDLTSL